MRRFSLAASLTCIALLGGIAAVEDAPLIGEPVRQAVAVDLPQDSPAAFDDLDQATAEELNDVKVPALAPDQPRKLTALERARGALAQSNAIAPSGQELCTTLREVARNSDLPLGFFTSLIWRESQFDHEAISPVGAMGIAQFMPDVADQLSVDAFDSRVALPASARLLRALRSRFGNLGLAAAAYNAGPKRVTDWLEGRANLPKETQDYVQFVTGRPATQWQNVKPPAVVYRLPARIPCRRDPAFAAVERAERALQEQVLAVEVRLAAQKAKEAAKHLAEERAKQRKSVAHSARLRIAARAQASRAMAPRSQAPVRLAQFRR